MAINLFSDYGGFYNNYRTNQIPKVDVATVREQDEAKRAAEAAVPSIPVVEETKPSEAVIDNRSRMADLENISLSFNKGDDFSYIGSDYAIADLDMEKAISDMRKDKILEDYQYFVGNREGYGLNTPADDGQVFLKF